MYENERRHLGMLSYYVDLLKTFEGIYQKVRGTHVLYPTRVGDGRVRLSVLGDIKIFSFINIRDIL